MTIFNDIADTIFTDSNISSAATYTPTVGSPSSVRVIVDDDVEILSMGDSEITDRRIVIGIRQSDISAPVPGDTILVGATTYTVNNVIADDGIETQVAVT